MPPHRSQPGPGEIAVPAYFVIDGDEAAQAAWTREHPDWFVAGSWSPPAPRPHGSATGADRTGWPSGTRAPGERPAGWERAALELLEPAGLSLADFRATAAAARAGLSGPHRPVTAQDPGANQSSLDPNIVLAQAGPSRPPRMSSGMRPRTTQEEFLEFRFDTAIARIRRVEPENRNLTYVRDPNKAPSDDAVMRLEAEAQMAEVRSQRAPRGGNGGVRDTPEQHLPRTTGDIISPEGKFIGYRHGRATDGVQTVTSAELDRIAIELSQGARVTPNPRYPGIWYTRQDGSSFGIRISPKNGITIDISEESLPKETRFHEYNLPFGSR